MKPLTKKQFVISTASIASVIFLLVIIISINFSKSVIIFIDIIGVLTMFGGIYFFTNYSLNKILFEKINPIYKSIHYTDTFSEELKQSIADKDILTVVEDKVNDWAKNKSKEIDQLKQLEKYRKEFLGNVSHELKTPIFNIQGYVLTLLDGGLEDPLINRLYLERTEKSINRMINIVEDLESISRLESGELKLELESFNIVSLTDDVFEMQEMLAEHQSIKLNYDKHYDKAIKVFADKKRITEVMNNLVVNSIKYGRKNGKTSVSFSDMGENILIEISDNGIGIAEKDLTRIFERFYRSDKSRSRDLGGTGLGLSIVKHIIEAHKQSIHVRSQQGTGSTFTFTLAKAKIK